MTPSVVMLSNAKHPEACTTIHRLRNLEILHFVQNDNPRQCHAEQRERCD